MKTDPTYYKDLITKYFSGEASPEEIRNLEDWVKSDPGNREEFRAMSRTWKMIIETSGLPEVDVDAEWMVFKEKSGLQPTEHRIRDNRFTGFRRAMLIAATILILLIPGYFILQSYFRTNEILTALVDTVTIIKLPDGTLVTLNKGATMSYPAEFKGNTRNISLTGEAWFEVTHDARHPFVIDAGKSRIEVLGTTFSVNTNAWGNREEVILQSGKVKVSLAKEPSTTVILDPGDKATVDAGGSSLDKSKNEDVNFLSWKTRHLIFSNTSLNEVVALLSKVYGTNIRISGSGLGECKITATFDHQSLESVLNVLKATLDLQIRNTGNFIEVSGSCETR